MRLLITRPLPERVVAAAGDLAQVELRTSTAPLDDAELRRALAEFDLLLPTLGDRFTADVFADVPAPRARLLANFGVGYNHIDVDAARAAGVAVTNTPGAVTDATADIALTLMLMTCRRAGEGERLLRAGQWTGWHPTQMLGLHMSGKRVGIIGMGNIGQAIARRCHFGFGMQVSYVTRTPRDLDFPAQALNGLTDLAAAVDVLVCCVPGGAETHHLVGAGVFAAMRPHAHFVNISRGDVVDEAALIAALKAGRIAGAGLDVYEFEPKVPAALRAMENVALLPHLGTAALEVREAMGMMAVDNIRAHLAGQTPPNLL
ncbi:2-hydroxyacid dehydrogenase [Rhodovulum adriaticum]|uniref:Hydroxypyruvate reductase n=1 Tax=Rhodovulum adriaticum TaxID=35804 RepID=A0A4R2NWI4_RHOAD|nr:D-glycerate dehydrogenase [Rhodovulum adriaticum]MBK1635207.1 D-glycerate dehydrogenase [Rhodovulum adriaticum]TCP26342.1 hydroxypyruvate reductase [Rhodovulum adriaticum]